MHDGIDEVQTELLDVSSHGCEGGPATEGLPSGDPASLSPVYLAKTSLETRQGAEGSNPMGQPIWQSDAASSSSTVKAAESRACVLWKCDEDMDVPAQRAYAIGASFALKSYAVKTRSKRPGCSLLIDTGSPTNLMSDSFKRELEIACNEYGVTEPKFRRREKPLRVGGIGSGTQTAEFDAKFSIGINQRIQDTAYPKFAEFASPVLPNSDVPGIIGQSSLRKNRAILVCFNLRMYTIGPGEATIKLPPGLRTV